jgi:hypothetical protein
VADSFRFNPDPNADHSFISQASHANAPGLKANISALGPEESRRSFGAPLAKCDMQPIWIAIDNDTDESLSYLPIETDPAYYSPCKVSFRSQGIFSVSANQLATPSSSTIR